MLNIDNVDVEMENAEPLLVSYLDSFFDLDSLIYHIQITKEGKKRYKDDVQGRITAVLMSSKNNPDSKKLERFKLVCPEWDLYYDESFIGFTEDDLNLAIAVVVEKEIHRIKESSHSFYSLLGKTD